MNPLLIVVRKMPDPLKMMGLGAEATPEEVRQRWRQIASDLHPDKGGRVEDFQKANAVHKQALDFAKKPRLCKACEGAGQKVLKMQGFTPVYTKCIPCDGVGKIELK